MQNVIQIHEKDNVAVVIGELTEGERFTLRNQTIEAKEHISGGHKIAIRSIPMNSPVVKYGHLIGYATKEIQAGEWVHTHNMHTGLGEQLEYVYEPSEEWSMVEDLSNLPSSFLGYERKDGRAGIRNEIWILPTVGCVNSVVTALANQAKMRNTAGTDGVVAFNHPYGCSQMGEDQENTRKILADLVKHPNAGGVLVVGLGCENSGIEILKGYLGEYDENKVRFMICQDCEDEIETGLQYIDELIAYASTNIRKPLPVSKLTIGLKCGGSDGFSGITANPVVGRFSDVLITKGGSSILTEVPEMFGAETILMNRCKDEALFQKTVTMINEFKEYFRSHGQTIYENPSPGNKKGGISSLEDKSLGCVQKSGDSSVCGVYGYAEPITSVGLNLLSAPGNDMVAATALAASGAQLVLFTTGRGTPFAAPVPTLKISSNTDLAKKKTGWIDFDAGTVLSEERTIEEMGKALYQKVIQIASGEQTKSEAAGYHDMAILKGGVTL